MYPANVFGMFTGDVLVSYWPIFFPVPINSSRRLCESELAKVPLRFC